MKRSSVRPANNESSPTKHFMCIFTTGPPPMNIHAHVVIIPTARDSNLTGTDTIKSEHPHEYSHVLRLRVIMRNASSSGGESVNVHGV